MPSSRSTGGAQPVAMPSERYDKREERRGSAAMVHVSPQWRQRQSALSVMNLASVSMILPLQNGHVAGRVTGPSPDSDSTMIFSVAARSACRVCNGAQIRVRHPVILAADHGHFENEVRMLPIAPAIPEDPPTSHFDMRGALSHGNQ